MLSMGTEKRERAVKTSTAIRREQIVTAALDLVGARGIKALTITAVAAEIGVVPSAIYRHFKGKGEVIDAIVELIGNRVQSNIKTVCAEAEDAVERLRLLHARHIRMIRENNGIPRLIFSEDIFDAQTENGSKERLYAIIQAYRRGVAEIVREGQERGTLRSDIAPEAVSLMFLGLIQPVAFLHHISDGAFDVPLETERSWHLFCRLIRPKPEMRCEEGANM